MKELVEVIAKALVDNPDAVVDVYKRQPYWSFTGSTAEAIHPFSYPG